MRNGRRTEIEAWWALLVRMFSFALGATIIGWQSFAEHADRPWIIVAGIGLCGPTVAISVATVLEAIRGGPGIKAEE